MKIEIHQMETLDGKPVYVYRYNQYTLEKGQRYNERPRASRRPWDSVATSDRQLAKAQAQVGEPCRWSEQTITLDSVPFNY